MIHGSYTFGTLMFKQPTLRPSDLVVACQLAITPGAQFLELSSVTCLSAGECHNAVRRLRLSKLLLPAERSTSVELLLQFLVHGAPFAFPAVIGQEVAGVPTGHSAPVFDGLLESAEQLVWPQADGTVRGRSVVPLAPRAAELPEKNPKLYELLTLSDALRTGTARVRKLAAELLGERLTKPSA